VPMTTNIVSSNPAQTLYSIQYYVIKFVSDLRQVVGFLHVLHSTRNGVSLTTYFHLRSLHQ
jgi:hypothetical protein